jgi:hypothetical protein
VKQIMPKPISLKEITGSPLARDVVEVKGFDNLRKLAADSPQARLGQGKTTIRITKHSPDTTIDITLQDVADMPAALDAIGYRKKEGILYKIYTWLFGRAQYPVNLASGGGACQH